MSKNRASNIINLVLIIVINILVVGLGCFLFNFRTIEAFKTGLLYSCGVYFMLFLMTISGGVKGFTGRPLYEASVGSGGLRKANEEFYRNDRVIMSFPIRMLFVSFITAMITIVI